MGSRQPPLSNTELESVIQSLEAGVRMDGRTLLEHRAIGINFGKDYGSCSVTFGETRILAQVTCEVVEPRPSRPNAGKVAVAVHISPMAGPEFESGRTSDAQDELQQLLENNIRESRCLDLEALCIMAEESVWQLRVDVTVMNNSGNLCDACNIAAVAALKHFHRPDVTVEEDGRVTIHSFSEREPIPTFLKKVPVCFSFAFCEFEDKLIIFADPTNLEERVVKGRLVVGLNPHGEITSLNFPGPIPLERGHIKFCISNAFKKAKEIAILVENAVDADLDKRKSESHNRGFADSNMKSDSQIQRESILNRIRLMETVSNQLKNIRMDIEQKEQCAPMEVVHEVKIEVHSDSSDEFSESEMNNTNLEQESMQSSNFSVLDEDVKFQEKVDKT